VNRWANFCCVYGAGYGLFALARKLDYESMQLCTAHAFPTATTLATRQAQVTIQCRITRNVPFETTSHTATDSSPFIVSRLPIR
jgi:hypothetical protein